MFREANSFPRAKLEENCELRGTDDVQGQTSVHIFEAKWMRKYFFRRPHFGRPFLKAFKRQIKSDSVQNIISLLKVFSFIHFNNLLGIKAKRANVNRRVPKLGNITWGISSVTIHQIFFAIGLNMSRDTAKTGEYQMIFPK